MLDKIIYKFCGAIDSMFDNIECAAIELRKYIKQQSKKGKKQNGRTSSNK